jgi:hypothetical protein
MHYPDGQEVRLGDKVALWEGCQGTIVALIEEGWFADGYESDDWAYLERGALIESDAAGLIHQTRPDDDWRLIGRSPPAQSLVRAAR